MGVLLAVATSITLIVYRVSHPHMPELGRLPGTDSFVELARHRGAETYPGTAIVRVETALYFTNAEPLANRLQDLEREHPELHTIVLDASGVNHSTPPPTTSSASSRRGTGTGASDCCS